MNLADLSKEMKARFEAIDEGMKDKRDKTNKIKALLNKRVEQYERLLQAIMEVTRLDDVNSFEKHSIKYCEKAIEKYEMQIRMYEQLKELERTHPYGSASGMTHYEGMIEFVNMLIGDQKEYMKEFQR